MLRIRITRFAVVVAATLGLVAVAPAIGAVHLAPVAQAAVAPPGAFEGQLRLIDVGPHYRIWTGSGWAQVEDYPTWQDGRASVITDTGVYTAGAGSKVWVS